MPFADEMIGAPVVAALIEGIAAVAPGRPLTALRGAELGTLSVRERSDLLRDALLADLPGDYRSFAATIRAALDRPSFRGWLIWPVSTAVAGKALEPGGDFRDAMALLAELTPRLTAEFAVRPLLAHDLGRALPIVREWAADADEHVRRLASEGTRPFLPWAKRVPRLTTDPRLTVPILDALYRDESADVRRSVANHLNDLSRIDPDLAVEVAAAWLAAPDPNTPRLVRHALRTLVKKGHPGALRLLGFTPDVGVAVTGPTLASTVVPFGGTVRFTAALTNTSAEPATVAVDYIVHHMKANGQPAGKTFKLATLTLAPGERRMISRDHSFRPITTRRYYPGTHAIELQLNGLVTGRSEFRLEAP
ncbi:MAG TPA: DNA alkylation repair protein [Actinoplanes sp.]|nr:DNA alkylation repair protein [Actinoplanes sp.]